MYIVHMQGRRGQTGPEASSTEAEARENNPRHPLHHHHHHLQHHTHHGQRRHCQVCGHQQGGQGQPGEYCRQNTGHTTAGVADASAAVDGEWSSRGGHQRRQL